MLAEPIRNHPVSIALMGDITKGGRQATAFCIQRKKVASMGKNTVVAAGGFEPSTLRV
jgi:hypothetical protein